MAVIAPKGGQRPNKAVVALLLLLVVFMVRSLRPVEDATSDLEPAATTRADATGTLPASAETEAEAPQPSLGSIVITAAEDAQRAVDALGGSGARLYSENCYAGLTAASQDAARHRCLAFDLIAARKLTVESDNSESDWFSDEAARARFTTAPGIDDVAAETAITQVVAATRTIVETGRRSQPKASQTAPALNFESAVQANDIMAEEGAEQGTEEPPPELEPQF